MSAVCVATGLVVGSLLLGCATSSSSARAPTLSDEVTSAPAAGSAFAHVGDSAVKHVVHATTSVNKFSNKLSSELLGRLLKTSLPRHLNLDNTTFGKPNYCAIPTSRLPYFSAFRTHPFSLSHYGHSFSREAIFDTKASGPGIIIGALASTPLGAQGAQKALKPEGRGRSQPGIHADQSVRPLEEFIPRMQDIGINSLTELQNVAIDRALEGFDVLVQSETGSGKTLCYALPMLAKLKSLTTHLQGLVLVPTFPLAAQIARVLNSLQPESATALDSATDKLPAAPIVVGPPGMLLKLLSSVDKAVLNTLHTIVLDEADTLLMPLQKPKAEETLFYVRKREKRAEQPMEAAMLLTQLCKARLLELQVMAVCAVLGRGVRREIQMLVGRRLNTVSSRNVIGEIDWAANSKRGSLVRKSQDSGTYVLPPKVSVGIVIRDEPVARRARVYRDHSESTLRLLGELGEYGEQVNERKVRAEDIDYVGALHDVIRMEGAMAPLLFIRPSSSVDKEVEMLQQSGLDAMPISVAVLAQKEITPSASNAEKGRRRILVAQPRDSRGLDLHGIDLVVINHVPKNADAFLHMAGRTARMGASGRVILLATYKEAEKNVRVLSKNLGYNLDVKRIELKRPDGKDSSTSGSELAQQRSRSPVDRPTTGINTMEKEGATTVQQERRRPMVGRPAIGSNSPRGESRPTTGSNAMRKEDANPAAQERRRPVVGRPTTGFNSPQAQQEGNEAEAEGAYHDDEEEGAIRDRKLAQQYFESLTRSPKH